MRFWNNSVQKAKLTHAKHDDYYFVNPKNGVTYQLRKDLRNNYHFEMCSATDDIFDEYETSQENIDCLLEKIAQFQNDLANAEAEKDGFVAVRLSKYDTLYYKRLQKETYHFIFVDSDEHIYNRIVTAKEFLAEFQEMLLSVCGISKELLASESSPLYRSAKANDAYLTAEIEYFCGRATRETVETLNAVRETPIFFAEKETYTEDDVSEIVEIRCEKRTFFNNRAYYYLKIRIDGGVYAAEWNPLEKALKMNCYQQRVNISDGLHERITVLAARKDKISY